MIKDLTSMSSYDFDKFVNKSEHVDMLANKARNEHLTFGEFYLDIINTLNKVKGQVVSTLHHPIIFNKDKDNVNDFVTRYMNDRIDRFYMGYFEGNFVLKLPQFTTNPESEFFNHQSNKTESLQMERFASKNVRKDWVKRNPDNFENNFYGYWLDDDLTVTPIDDESVYFVWMRVKEDLLHEIEE